MPLFDWLRSQLRRRKTPVTPSVAADELGISVTTERHTRAIPWSYITRLIAYKADLYTYDCIMLHIEVDQPKVDTVLVSEESPGFAGLFGPMEQALGVNPSWYLEIMTPAFEPKPIVLFVRNPEP